MSMMVLHWQNAWHCVYDPKKNIYYGEYTYYLTDYYDFNFGDMFKEQNLLGYAKSYKLYGKTKGGFQ